MDANASPVTLFPEPEVAKPAHSHRTPWHQALGPQNRLPAVSTSPLPFLAHPFPGTPSLTPQAMSALCALCPEQAGGLVDLFLHGWHGAPPQGHSLRLILYSQVFINSGLCQAPRRAAGTSSGPKLSEWEEQMLNV